MVPPAVTSSGNIRRTITSINEQPRTIDTSFQLDLGEAPLAVESIRNVDPDPSRLADGVTVISFVTQQGCPVWNGLDQRIGVAGILNLPACQSQTDKASSASTRV